MNETAKRSRDIFMNGPEEGGLGLVRVYKQWGRRALSGSPLKQSEK